MKRAIFAAIIALTSISCSKLVGQGDIVETDFDFGTTHINSIYVSDGFSVTFSDDVDSNGVIIETYENVLSYVTVKYDSANYRLYISMDANKTEGDLNLVAKMKLPSTCSVFNGSGGSVFNVNSAASNGASAIYLTGGSRFNGYNYTSADLKVSMSGSSAEITMQDGAKISGNMSGGSTIKYKGGTITNNAEMSGGSSVTLVE